MATITPHRMDWPTELGPCPACGQPITATCVAEVTPGATIEHGEGGASLQLAGKVLGLRVSHDCVPQVQRGIVDARPHSRACGIRPHSHGPSCSSDCPSCHGRNG